MSSLETFTGALTCALRDRNVDAAALARAIGAGDRQFKAWTTGTAEPIPAVVFDIEHVLGVAPGELSRHLGYVPVACLGSDRHLADAVERSPLLSEEEKRVVTAVIRMMVARHQMRLSVVPTRRPRGPERRPGRPSGLRVAVGSTLEDLREEWSGVVRSEGATRNTVENYWSAVEQLRVFLAKEGRSDHADAIQQVDVEDFLAELLMRNSPTTVQSRYRALRVFFAWLVDAGEIAVSPMKNIRPPRPSPGTGPPTVGTPPLTAGTLRP